jgi:hypothetical protein
MSKNGQVPRLGSAHIKLSVATFCAKVVLHYKELVSIIKANCNGCYCLRNCFGTSYFYRQDQIYCAVLCNEKFSLSNANEIFFWNGFCKKFDTY